MGGGTGGSLQAPLNPNVGRASGSNRFSDLEHALDSLPIVDRLSRADRTYIRGVRNCFENAVYDAERLAGVGFGFSSRMHTDITTHWFHPSSVYDWVRSRDEAREAFTVQPANNPAEVMFHSIEGGLRGDAGEYWQGRLEQAWRGTDWYDERRVYEVTDPSKGYRSALHAVLFIDDMH